MSNGWKIVPVMPGLVQDMTNEILLDGLVRYKMSMVSNAWYKYCYGSVFRITTKYELKDAILDMDIIRILRNFEYISDHSDSLMVKCCEKWELWMIEIVIRKAISHWESALSKPLSVITATDVCGYTPLYLQFKKEIIDLNAGLRGACRGGNTDVISALCREGADSKIDGLRGACRGGHTGIAKLMIPDEGYGIDGAISEAYRGGHIDTIEFMEKFVRSCKTYFPTYKPYEFWINACRSGNIELVRQLIDMGEKWWNHGLRSACAGGHIAIVRLLVAKGANDYEDGLYTACTKRRLTQGKLEVMKLMIEKGAKDCRCGDSIANHVAWIAKNKN